MAMKRKKRLKNSLINLFLLFLLVIGFALIFNRQIRSFLMARTSDSYQISNVDRAEIENNLKLNSQIGILHNKTLKSSIYNKLISKLLKSKHDFLKKIDQYYNQIKK